MKNKGFTLIELLASVTILGIIMLIAVPSVATILSNNRKQTFLNDAKKFIALSEEVARKNSYRYDCFTLNSESSSCYNIVTQDIEKSPYQKKYLANSRVIQCIYNGDYYYKVYLTDGYKSIEGAIKIKEKDAPNQFKNINEEKDSRLNFISDFNTSYTLTCKLE